jgi:hypothetical protein
MDARRFSAGDIKLRLDVTPRSHDRCRGRRIRELLNYAPVRPAPALVFRTCIAASLTLVRKSGAPTDIPSPALWQTSHICRAYKRRMTDSRQILRSVTPPMLLRNP